jgi:hypothetical protein
MLGFGHWSDLEFRLPIPNWNPVCTDNLIRVDDVMESPELAE